MQTQGESPVTDKRHRRPPSPRTNPRQDERTRSEKWQFNDWAMI